MDRPVSFAYIDFDKSLHDPRNGTALLRQLAQQLRLLYATSAASEQFAALESAYGGTDILRAAELLDIDVDADGSTLLDTLCDRLLEMSGRRERPLLLFLDTFEEVIAEGPGAVSDVGVLCADLLKRMPDMRIVVAGRTVPTTLPGRTIHLELSDLDYVASDAVLERLGVSEHDLRQLIIDNFGMNPLTLRLAAEVLQRGGPADEAFGDVISRTRALAETALEQVQGMLYSRILGHIRDSEVADVAHPGLAVRLVTVDVLRRVLAGPCGLDPDRAEDIFSKLQTEMSLFEPQSDGSLRHRQDVRRIMLRAMLNDPVRGPKVAEIHVKAIEYYQTRTGSQARAELLYHRLMSDDDPRQLDHLWDIELAKSLTPALEEPLPSRAHRWLERRVVLGGKGPDDLAQWEQEDWEANAHSRAASFLSSGLPMEALSVLEERNTRLSPSRLYAIEVAALLATGRTRQAASVLKVGLQSAEGGSDHRVSLELAEQSVAVRAAEGDIAGLAAAGLACASLADVTGEPSRAIAALASTVAELNRLGDEEHLPIIQAELARRFKQLSRSELQAEPDMVRRVLHTSGSFDSGVLNHAAIAVGDQTNEDTGIFFEDAFALTRVLDSTTP